jgi:hypothetical protein
VSLSPAPTVTVQAVQGHLKLHVKVIVKDSISQRDRTGTTLEPLTITGNTFTDMVRRLWDQFGKYVKHCAVKTDGTWSIEPPTFEIWQKLMQFRFKRHPVMHGIDDEESWNKWVPTTAKATVDLVIYKYGAAITKNSDLEEFELACIRPQHTDRSGAAAERELQAIVEQLQAKWGRTYTAKTAIWRMWASAVIENLDRSTWEARINEGQPPRHVACLLRPANATVEAHLLNLRQSVTLAKQCVTASIKEYEEIRESFDALGRKLEEHRRSLADRMEMVSAFETDLRPVGMDMVNDPSETMENIPDTEHEE